MRNVFTFVGNTCPSASIHTKNNIIYDDMGYLRMKKIHWRKIKEESKHPPNKSYNCSMEFKQGDRDGFRNEVVFQC